MVETIKEGATVCIATPEDNRRAELMMRPGSDGERSLARLLALVGTVSDAGHPVEHAQSHAATCLHRGVLDALASGL